MNWGSIFRIAIMVTALGSALYTFIDKQNTLTSLRIRLPQLEKEYLAVNEENKRLQYEIDHFESPSHLMELARCVEFSHLQHPFIEDVLSITSGVALADPIKEERENPLSTRKSMPLAVGRK